jgi:dolichol-phosphate mannosyltransferase
MKLISIVVPVYQNATSLVELAARFDRLAASEPDHRFEFLFVDDGSTDGSFDVLERLAAHDERIVVIKLSRNFGADPAVLAGLARAKGDAVAVISADLQDPPELIGEMLARYRTGKKVVIAARSSRDDPWLTAVLANLFYILFRRFALKTMPRNGYDFFLIDRHICDLINQIQENNAYLTGLILWLGFEHDIVYYHRRERERRFGVSMWTMAKKLKYFADSFVAFSYFPIRAASVAGIGLSLLGFLFAVTVVIERLVFGIRAEGWASLMVVLLIVSGAQLVMMGILGEYLWRNLDETRRRPRFVVERVIEGNAASADRRRASSMPETAPNGSIAAFTAANLAELPTGAVTERAR